MLITTVDSYFWYIMLSIEQLLAKCSCRMMNSITSLILSIAVSHVNMTIHYRDSTLLIARVGVESGLGQLGPETQTGIIKMRDYLRILKLYIKSRS